ncbi:hypothetical protein T07_3736 [Trichinella nelsoni]|uniref:Uncharacterized protein n=1 Tax=Trichinella nelsoni TaxID=6336 RepID=A0A0V0RB79_9BILA|nr:hypothetical protein T07_3736 [Trichinella nelsoni]
MVHLESIVSTDVFGRSSASVYTHGTQTNKAIATNQAHHNAFPIPSHP